MTAKDLLRGVFDKQSRALAAALLLLLAALFLPAVALRATPMSGWSTSTSRRA